MSDLIESSDLSSRKASDQGNRSSSCDERLYSNPVSRRGFGIRTSGKSASSTTTGNTGMTVWQAMLSVLCTPAEAEQTTRNSVALYASPPVKSKSSGKASQHSKTPCSVVFSSIERASPRTLWVSWHEATIGRYSEQRWVRCVSRNRGICALSGAPIRRGDSIYRPSTRSAMKPCNIGAMILETSVDAHLSQLANLAFNRDWGND
jgi:hypothetical protein